jgi:RHS repeat-associated protein
VAASYRYDPYGNTISSSGGLASANVYRFSSKEIHVNSGLYYYGYRFYAPNLQRWLNRDPIDENGGINLYGFVLNGPIATIDPDGRDMFPRIPTIPSFPWPYPFPRPRFPRSFEFPGIQISLPCYSAVKKADSEARAEFDEIKDSYTCMVNGTKKELADFPGAVENTKSSYGVLHCLLGHYANKNGAGTACLVAANYVFEMFMEREWSRKPPGEWYRDTSDDMAEVFTGAKLDAPEDCIPCECKKK